MADDIRVKRTKLSDYRKNPKNHNKSNERGKAMIGHSFDTYGAGRSLLADKHGVFIAGNQSTDGAEAAGITDVIEVTTTGRELVVVRREDLDLDGDDMRAVELGYLDNRSAQASLNFDAAQIAADLERGVDLSAMWSTPELNGLLDMPIPDVPDAAGQGSSRDGAPVDIPQQYLVVVTCTSEQHQAQLLERLTAEGFECRALLS